jgi:hypothetical protein
MLGVVKSVEVVTLDVTTGLTSLGVNLTKGQTVANCVPFLTSQNVGNTYQPDRWMMDVYFTDSPARVTIERTTTGSRIICVVVIVEFDPNKVRVQQKSFSVPNAASANVTLDYAITDGRAAMVHHYRMATGTATQARYWALRRYFNGTTQVTLVRESGGGTTLAGNLYVFESLDGAFTTQNITLSMAAAVTTDTDTISEVDLSKSWIVPCSIYSERNHAEAEDSFAFVRFQSSTVVQVNRRGSVSALVLSSQVVKHHDDTYVDHGQFDFGSSDPTDRDHQDVLPDAVDTDYSAPIVTIRDGMIECPSTYSATDYYKYFARCWYSPTVSGIRGYRQNGSEAGILRWQSVEFAPAPGYFFAGYVTELGSPVERTVRAYHRDTGELLGETTSSGVGGYYYLETTYSGAQYIITLDDPSGDTYNLLGYDLMIPTTISG